MMVFTIVLAFMLDPDWSLTDEDLDFYAYRPVVEIDEEPTLEDVEFERNYKDVIERVQKIYPHVGGEQ